MPHADLEQEGKHPSSYHLADQPQRQQRRQAVITPQDGQHNIVCCVQGLAAPEDCLLPARHAR